MQSEQAAADRLELNWKTRFFCPQTRGQDNPITQISSLPEKNFNSKITRIKYYINFRRDYYRWLKSMEEKTDIFLLRHNTNDPMQYNFIRDSKKPVFLIHHTIETKELATSGLQSIPAVLLETYFGRKSIRESDCVIGVTQEIIDYEISRIRNRGKNTILYPNGILFDEPTVADKRSENPELAFVAGHFAPWQGLDLLINNLKISNRDFTLHLVGNLDEKVANLARKDSRIKLHGPLPNDCIKIIYEKCSLGLSSFGLSRKGMEQACTLKVREYLASGLPVYADHQDIFPESFRFYKKGPPEIDKIIDFAIAMNKVERSEISSYARRYIDKEILLKNLYDQILNCNFS
jgi:glycosyltransferase involved in cell wall biosynthesis